jgi:RNA polymerase sigma factor (sigma-70 family)
MNDTATDDYLVGRLAIGDRSALGELCARYRRSVIAYFRKRTWRSVDHEALAGVVFDKVARKAASYEPQGRFTGWLFAIARNVLKDELRRDTRQRARDGLWHVTKRGSVGRQASNACGEPSEDDDAGVYASNELVDVSFHTRGVDVSVRFRRGELEKRGHSDWKEIKRMFRFFGLVDGPTPELNKKSYNITKINAEKSAFGGVIPMERGMQMSCNGSRPPKVQDRTTCQICARRSKCNRVGSEYVCGPCEREAATNWFVARQLQTLSAGALEIL